MSKFDFTKTIDRVQGSYKTDQRMAKQIGLGDALEEISNDPADYIVMDPADFPGGGRFIALACGVAWRRCRRMGGSSSRLRSPFVDRHKRGNANETP